MKLASLPHFQHILKKIISVILFYYLTRFLFWLSLHREILGNTCVAIVCLPGCEVINFEINFILPINLFFLYDQKVKIKI